MLLHAVHIPLPATHEYISNAIIYHTQKATIHYIHVEVIQTVCEHIRHVQSAAYKMCMYIYDILTIIALSRNIHLHSLTHMMDYHKLHSLTREAVDIHMPLTLPLPVTLVSYTRYARPFPRFQRVCQSPHRPAVREVVTDQRYGGHVRVGSIVLIIRSCMDIQIMIWVYVYV